MRHPVDRRDFLRLSAFGGVVFASGLAGCADYGQGKTRDFHFVQLSDVHWGFNGPAVNPEAATTLKRAVAAVNALPSPPDFIVFTGDLTHTTDDAQERRKRMREFKAIVADLSVRQVHFMPGEHDASLDNGAAFQEFFGATRYSFDHAGVHFVAVDNVSDPAASIGAEQLDWLRGDLGRLNVDAPIVVLTHRPLFDLVPKWDWATRDGDQAIAILMPYRNVTVLYGHIHQEHHHMTGHIAHHAAQSLIFPLPAPGSQERRDPIRWDPTQPYRGLGFREVSEAGNAAPVLREQALGAA
jgi:hypothetical protein